MVSKPMRMFHLIYKPFMMRYPDPWDPPVPDDSSECLIHLQKPTEYKRHPA